VGIVLTVAPLLSPFLMTAPRTALPIADEEGEKATLRLARRLGEKVDSGDACLVCQRQGALREA
jgi:hypothetical protein